MTRAVPLFICILSGLAIPVSAEPVHHWAYQAPRRPALPAVGDSSWPRNAIDYLVLARIEREGLRPSPEADKQTLIRRVTLDLTGLPPTLEEIDAFLADDSPGAYERLVGRLLASPRYGQRMAVHWLDLARYADTHGYHMDAHRDMWRWRDWVIDALNDNMPFDQFTIEQLAGDLLPHATLSQRIATGFHRNNMVNFENGAIAEEFLTEYAVDRVVTTATVWLGQTLACCRCHDHKYDPFTQKDFYRLFAFFNNVPEKGIDGDQGNAAPLIRAPLPHQQLQLDALDGEIASLERALAERESQAGAALAEREARGLAGGLIARQPPGDVLVHFPLDESQGEVALDAAASRRASVRGNPIWVAGKFGGALLFDGGTHVDAGDVARLDRAQPWSLAAWVFPTTSDRMAVLSRTDETSKLRGYELVLEDGRISLRLVHDGQDNSLRVATKTPLELRKWQHVLATYDGSSKAVGVNVYVDGQLQEVESVRESLSGPIQSDGPLRIGGRAGEATFRGMIDEVRVYPRELTAGEAAVLAGGDPIRQIIATAPDRRTGQQIARLRRYYLENHEEVYRRLRAELAIAGRQIEETLQSAPTTMIMQEMTPRQDTFVLGLGRYDRPEGRVGPGTPAILPPMPKDAPCNRLGLAQWLVDPANPLTARVTVNRLWQLHFGTGLVRTADDFGTRGQRPSHRELLDWLATEFVGSGWDVKHLQRRIVTSATYRQSSRVTSELLARDPENRLLARGPRLRLEAEAIRDGALLISGLLDERIGGPSVFPYQPPGLWEEVSYDPDKYTAQVYRQSRGRDLYRRSLYTFWKRSVPPPALAAFDAPSRETCTVTRPPTNTPLQALVLMNDPTFVEAARGSAERMMREGGDQPRERIEFAFRCATGRQPTGAESSVLVLAYQRQLEVYRRVPEAAQKLLSVGESGRDEIFDLSELAAWTTIGNTILMLDETITRE